MNDKHIQAILAVLNEGSITGAARKLFVSQPALSQMIKNAENNLGSPIFNRTTDPITLTAAGELYVDAARQILTINGNLEKQIEELKKEASARSAWGFPSSRGWKSCRNSSPSSTAGFPMCGWNCWSWVPTTSRKSCWRGRWTSPASPPPLGGRSWFTA